MAKTKAAFSKVRGKDEWVLNPEVHELERERAKFNVREAVRKMRQAGITKDIALVTVLEGIDEALLDDTYQMFFESAGSSFPAR